MNPDRSPALMCPRRYPFGGTDHTVDLEPDYRDCGPVESVELPGGRRAWLVLDHALVRRVLADPVFSREQANHPDVARLSTEVLPAAAILANDPPRHTRLRAMVAGMFAPRRIDMMAATIDALAIRLLEQLTATGGQADLLSGWVEPYAAGVVCEMFGVPERLRARVFALGDALTAREATTDSLAAARSDCEDLVRGMAVEHPHHELFGLLGESPEQDTEVINLVIACLIGGRGSPTVFLSSAVYVLLRQPWRYRWLVQRPAAIPAAMEELLRFVPVGVGGGFTRVVTSDVQLGAVTVRAGEAVIPAMHAAGRDSAVFDRPDDLDLDRSAAVPHLAFGHGPHYCLGAGLARLEARIALHTLTTRLPDLQLVTPADGVRWRRGRVVRALERLEVTWTPA